MKVVFASDSFKGTLSSEKIITLLTRAAKKVFPDCETAGIAVADGGEGTIDAVISALHGHIREVEVCGPLMERVMSRYGMFGERSAIIEMAEASGLPMVPNRMRDPRKTTSYGTGELIRDALDEGCRDITIAIGGSATNDGGMGAMRALGVKFLDQKGHELTGRGDELGLVADVDMSGLHPAVGHTQFTVMCDVTNPLTGPDGATYTFGPQKGGTPKVLGELEQGMVHYASLLHEKLGVDIDGVPGAGAAGGLGAAFCVFLHGTMKSGIETVLDLIHFDELLKDADLVVTGEGRIDWQSAFGKVANGIGIRCEKMGIPAIAIVGGMGDGAEAIYDCGISSIMTTVNGAMELEEALKCAEELYSGAAERAFRMIRAGMEIGKDGNKKTKITET